MTDIVDKSKESNTHKIGLLEEENRHDIIEAKIKE